MNAISFHTLGLTIKLNRSSGPPWTDLVIKAVYFIITLSCYSQVYIYKLRKQISRKQISRKQIFTFGLFTINNIILNHKSLGWPASFIKAVFHRFKFSNTSCARGNPSPDARLADKAYWACVDTGSLGTKFCLQVTWFCIKLIKSPTWVLLCSFVVARGRSSNLMPPAKPRTRVPGSFSGPLLTDGTVSPCSPWATSWSRCSQCYWLINWVGTSFCINN